MTSRDFCFWLQGYFEIHANQPTQPERSRWNLNDSQIEMVRRHLALVFKHEIDPSMGAAAKQGVLNAIHNPPNNNGEILMRC